MALKASSDRRASDLTALICRLMWAYSEQFHTYFFLQCSYLIFHKSKTGHSPALLQLAWSPLKYNSFAYTSMSYLYLFNLRLLSLFSTLAILAYTTTFFFTFNLKTFYTCWHTNQLLIQSGDNFRKMGTLAREATHVKML